jgi:small-conductance mechanosensitive channel
MNKNGTGKKLRYPIFFLLFLFGFLFLRRGVCYPWLGGYVSEGAYYAVTGTLFFVILGVFLSRFVRVFVLDAMVKRRMGMPPPKLLSDIVNGLIYFSVFVMMLHYVFGYDVRGLLATSGVMVAVVGFALKNMISNIFSGITLNIEQPYKIGDWLEIDIPTRHSRLLTGRVTQITIRSTRLLTQAEETVVVPNGKMAESSIVNFSAPERRYRAQAAVSFDQSMPEERVVRILTSAMKSAEGVLESPAPDVVLREFTDRGVVWAARFWVGDFSQDAPVRSGVQKKILNYLQIAGIPFSSDRKDVRIIRTGALEMSRRPAVKPLLKNLDIFAGLGEAELEALAERISERRFEAGQCVVRQGRQGDSLFIAAEGVLCVRLKNDDGRESTVGKIEPGQYFGEMTLLTGQPRSATVEADTDVIVYEIKRDVMEPILRENPRVVTGISDVLAERNVRNVKCLADAKDEAVTESKEDVSHGIFKNITEFFKIGKRG